MLSFLFNSFRFDTCNFFPFPAAFLIGEDRLALDDGAIFGDQLGAADLILVWKRHADVKKQRQIGQQRMLKVDRRYDTK